MNRDSEIVNSKISINSVFARHETFHPRFGWIKKGFDAAKQNSGVFLQIRRTPDSLLEEAASVEFEYELSNFFKHGHPVLQTNYIICWTTGNLPDGVIRSGKEGIGTDSSTIAVRMRSSSWMKVLSFEEHIIYVLPIEKLPNLIIRRNIT